MREFIGWIIAAIVTVAIIYVFAFTSLIFNRHAAPYAEETRRITYDESRTYQQGMAVDLDDLCRQRRISSDEGVKSVLADTIRLRSARYTGNLPSHVQECVNEVR